MDGGQRCLRILIMLYMLSETSCITRSSGLDQSRPSSGQCRDREGYYSRDQFSLKSCGDCYHYLFQEQQEFVYIGNGKMIREKKQFGNNSFVPEYEILFPDIRNETNVEIICRTLKDSQCESWIQCCRTANDCCERQLKSSNSNTDSCPQTWDGFSCWDETTHGMTSSKTCPSFMKYASRAARVHKTCTENGTWYIHHSGLEWTDYTQCLDIGINTKVLLIGVVCQILSIPLLLVSLVIFLSYRELRKQHRIRLHVNLFTSFILTSIIFITWDAVTFPGSINSKDEIGCKVLYAIMQYSRSTNFVWMFCEGYYLHRLIVRAFEPPKNLWVFYLIGWGFPVIPVAIYCGIRVVHADTSCWMDNMGHMEWIIYAPNVIALLLNLGFLCNILRILLTQLQFHPNEPNNYRRAFKATFIMMPLFGVQLIFIIYRPPFHLAISEAYEIIAAIIIHSQGICISVVFCFWNSEVLTHLKKTLSRWRKNHWEDRRTGYESTSTHVTEYSSATNLRHGSVSNSNYIAMTPVNGRNPDTKTNVHT